MSLVPIVDVSPPPTKPLDVLFRTKWTEPPHDFPRELVDRLYHYMDDTKNQNHKQNMYPIEYKDFLLVALQTPYIHYRILAILGLTLVIEEFRAYLFCDENEYTKNTLLTEIDKGIHNYICGLKTDGHKFKLIEINGKKEPIEGKHEITAGWLVEHLREIYISL